MIFIGWKELLMKKFLFFIIFTFIANCCFGRAFLAFDDSGIQFSYDGSAAETSFDYDFFDVAGMSLLGGWEFNSKDIDSKVHYLTGINMGLEVSTTICVGLFGGVNYTLFDFGKVILELRGIVEAGWASQLLFDNGFINGIYNQNTADLTFMLKSRKYFFIGAGVSNYNLIDLSESKNFGSTIGYHLIGGIVF